MKSNEIAGNGAAAVPEGWRPIETAPKDAAGMVLTDGIAVTYGGWVSDVDQGAEWEGQLGCASWWTVDGPNKFAPTHWMPLPAAPGSAPSGVSAPAAGVPELPEFANSQRLLWLCEDHAGANTRAIRDDILARMPVMSRSAAYQAIDYAMMGEYHLPAAPPAANAQPAEPVAQAEQQPCGSRENCARFPFCGCGEPPLFPERDHTKPAEEQGMFRKFEVRRVDGSDGMGGKHYGCRYFVLDMNHDAHAPAALRAYAQSCKDTHPQLSADLLAEFPEPAQQPQEALPPLHGFTAEDLTNIADALENGYEQRIGIGNNTGMGEEYLPTATASAALFIRAALSRAPVPEAGLTDVVIQAAQQAKEVFSDSCNHTHEAIEYLKQLILVAAKEPR